jgi:hypothetical protein
VARKPIPPYLFLAWSNMFRRCYYVDDPSYPHYGGRGIRVCRRWNSLDTFCLDVGPRPSPKHSLDRKDNDGDYSPRNCRWATVQEQVVNRRVTRWLEHQGHRLTLTAWAAQAGLSVNTVRSRLRRGWSPQQILDTPSDRPSGNGRVRHRTAAVLCRQAGIPLATFYWRLKNGWNEEDALHTPRHQKPHARSCVRRAG